MLSLSHQGLKIRNMEKNFNAQDSLSLINEMITQTRNNIRIGSANSMIFCGYCTAIIAIVNIVLMYVLENPNQSFWVWTLTIPMAIISRIMNSKQDKQAIVRTPIDRIVSKVWLGFIVSVAVFLTSVFMGMFFMNIWISSVFIMPVMLVLTGLAEYITGSATNFRAFIRGAYMFWLGALLSILLFLVFDTIHFQFVIFVICILTGFIIPGHILNRKAKEYV